MTVPAQPALTSDAELLDRVREGDSEAYAVLYRRHAEAAHRFATALAHDGGEAEDLAAEAFARILASLRGGRGPQTVFEPYLLTAVRNAFYDRVRRTARVQPTDTIEDYEKPEPYEDPSIAALERSYAARAFARLPERCRAVLWHTEIEGETPTQIAPLFGLSANAVAVLAFRARERLKQGYLAEHITLTGSPRCHWAEVHLPGYVRANLAGRDRVKVEDHLAGCAECRRLHRELSDANVSPQHACRREHGRRGTAGSGRPAGTAGNFPKGDSPSATAPVCATHADGCVWRTPGVDIAQYAGRSTAASTVAVEPAMTRSGWDC